jgi:serine/threonine protein phosphatase 1
VKGRDFTAAERRPVFVGDIHARPELLEAVLRDYGDLRVILLGDLLDGPGGARGSAELVKMARKNAVEMVLGNHELYPIFATSRQQLAQWWGEDPHGETAERVWQEWIAIRSLLDDEDMAWLRSCPLYLRGEGWIAVHAKTLSTLPAQYVTGAPTQAQIELVDHTESTPFWAEAYDGRFGHAYFGHTRLSKVGRAQWPHATLLDWDAKKGGTCGVCVLGGTPRALLG